MKDFMTKRIIGAFALRSWTACLLLLLLMCQVSADVQIDFINGNGLDGQGIGGSITVTDSGIDVTLSTVDIIGFDGTSPCACRLPVATPRFV
jgi:hypothetical protein